VPMGLTRLGRAPLGCQGTGRSRPRRWQIGEIPRVVDQRCYAGQHGDQVFVCHLRTACVGKPWRRGFTQRRHREFRVMCTSTPGSAVPDDLSRADSSCRQATPNRLCRGDSTSQTLRT
jgi:hypothetical protein